jgi:hypothetical protein
MRIALSGGSCNSHPSGTSPRYLVKKTTGQLFQVYVLIMPTLTITMHLCMSLKVLLPSLLPVTYYLPSCSRCSPSCIRKSERRRHSNSNASFLNIIDSEYYNLLISTFTRVTIRNDLKWLWMTRDAFTTRDDVGWCRMMRDGDGVMMGWWWGDDWIWFWKVIVRDCI